MQRSRRVTTPLRIPWGFEAASLCTAPGMSRCDVDGGDPEATLPRGRIPLVRLRGLSVERVAWHISA
jgi:hypothetical protein